MFGLFRKKKKSKQEEPKKVVVQEEKKVEPKKVEPVTPELVTPEPVKEEVSEEPKKEEKEEVKKPARKMPYHITKHTDGGWQIKRGKAKKALKRFETQKEAIEYAKVLEKEKGESYIIHKANGTTRKKTY